MAYPDDNEIGEILGIEFTEANGVTYPVPSTPAAGQLKLYPKSDHLLYIKDSTGTETVLDTGTSGAPSNATYITQTPNSTLTNEQALSILATGILKSTTATGVISIAAAGTDYTSPTGTENLSNKTITGGTINNSVIGGVTPAAGTFTTLTGTTGTFTDIVTITKTTQQLSLNYDGSNKTAFTVSSGGDLTIAPTGNDTTLTSTLLLKPGSDSTSVFKIQNAAGSIDIMTVDSTNNALAIGTTTSTANHLAIAKTFADIAATSRGIQLTTTFTLSANNGFNMRAYNTTLSINNGNFNATGTPVTGVASVMNVATTGAGSGTITAVAGGNAQISHGAGGTISSAYSYYAETPTNTGGGTITKMIGLAINSHTVGTNNTYVLLGTATAPTGNWTIHATTTNDSALAGKLKLGATTAPGTTLDVLTSDAVTAAVTNVVTIGHDSSGTPAANYGTGIPVQGKSSTTAGQSMGDLQWIWTVATHASRTARGILTAYDTAVRTCIQWEASGSAAMVGFLGTAPIIKITTGVAGAAFTANSGTAVNDASTFGGYTLKQIAQALQNYGLLT